LVFNIYFKSDVTDPLKTNERIVMKNISVLMSMLSVLSCSLAPSPKESRAVAQISPVDLVSSAKSCLKIEERLARAAGSVFAVCTDSKDESLAKLPYILVLKGQKKIDLYRGNTPMADEVITLGNKQIDVKKLDGNYEIQQCEDTQIKIFGKWGSRLDLTGYYGDKTIEINLNTGKALLSNHMIPHLFSDFNAPQAEHTAVDELNCQIF
jgi:hypothetical protein